MANVSYDTLTIQINADSKQANSSINNLSKNLQKLDEVAKNLNKEKIEEVKTLLIDIASIDFSNVSKGLQDVVSAFKAFNNQRFMKATSNGADLGASLIPKGNNGEADVGGLVNEIGRSSYVIFDVVNSMNAYHKSLEENAFAIANTTEKTIEYQQALNWLKVSIDGCGSKTEEIGNKLYEMGFNATQTNAILRAMNKEIDTFTPDQLLQLKEMFEEFGLEAEEVDIILKQLKLSSDDLNKALKKTQRPMAKMFANILKYRIIRMLIQKVMSDAMNAITTLAQEDASFNHSLGEIRNAVDNIARAIIGTIVPAIRIISPIINMLGNALTDVLNVASEYVAMIAGQDYYYKAVKSVEDFTDTLNKQKNNLTLGIDELNFIKDNEEQRWERVEISNQTKSLKVIADALVNLEPIIKAIADTLFVLPLQAIYTILKGYEPAFVLISAILSTIADFVGALLLSIPLIIKGIFTGEWDGLKQLWGNTFKNIGEVWKDFVDEFMPSMQEATKSLNDILNFLKGGILGAQGVKAQTGNKWFDVGWRALLGGLTGGLSLILTGTGFASGGFPEDGLFYANHNELVGRFSNGQTAVANNEQIIAGIRQGVVEAMRESGGGNVNVFIDGQELSKIVEKNINNRGSDIVYGGAIRYGK